MKQAGKEHAATSAGSVSIGALVDKVAKLEEKVEKLQQDELKDFFDI